MGIVFTLDTPENLEVAGEAAISYANENDLTGKLRRVLRDGSLVHAYRQRAQERIRKFYDWEGVVDRYEELFARISNKPLHVSHTQDWVEETQKESVGVGRR